MVTITNLDRLDTLSGVGAVNANFAALKAAIEVLSSNKLSAALDANSKRIFNLAPATTPNGAVSLAQLAELTVDPSELDDIQIDIAELVSDNVSLQAAVSSLTTLNANLQASLASALARITALEGGVIPPVVPTTANTFANSTTVQATQLSSGLDAKVILINNALATGGF